MNGRNSAAGKANVVKLCKGIRQRGVVGRCCIGRGGAGRVRGGGIEGRSRMETALRGGGGVNRRGVGRRMRHGKFVWGHGTVVRARDLIGGIRRLGSGQGRVRRRILRLRDPGEGGGWGGICARWIISGVVGKGLGRGGQTGHVGEPELVETVGIKVGSGREAVGRGLAVDGPRDIATEGNEELVYGGKLLWGANVKGDGAGVEVVLDIVGVGEVVETLCHVCGEDEGRGRAVRWIRTVIVCGSDLALLDVGEKVVDGMIIGALAARGRDGLGLVGVPGGDLVVEKEVVGGGSDVARGILVQVRGRVVCVGGWYGVSKGGGKGECSTV